MSTERRRNAGGGRRRAQGPAEPPRGSGDRRRADGPARDERAGGRRGGTGDDGGFWDDDRPAPRRRPEGSRSEGARSEGRSRSEGRRSEGGRSEGGRRRTAPPPDGRREREHGSRSGGSRRAGGGGGGRRRPPGRGRDGFDDEHDDRGPVKRFFAKTWKPALIIGGVLFAGVVAALTVFYISLGNAEDMEAQAAAVKEASVFTDASEEEIVTTGDVNRQAVTYDEIPQTVVNGVLGTEQRTFPTDGGISITGTMRAVLSGGSAGGGSTITQQMARNYYDGLSQDRTYTRKLKEMVIAIKLGNELSKEEIITQYLNTIYFGRNAYGVQAAAQAYFGKDLSDLDQAEGAFIGSIIQQPGNFENYEADPAMEELLRARWENDSVEGMVVMNEDYPEYGISASEAEELEFPETVPYDIGQDLSGYKGYVRDAVMRELQARYGVEPEQVSKGGYQVTTSIDQGLMKRAEDVFGEVLPEEMPDDTNYGLTSVDPSTGEVKAFYGGADFTVDTNNSLTERAQAGSAFKPYVLAAGLESGISLESEFDGDSPQTFEGVEGEIQNDSNRSWGPVDLTHSTKHSVNTAFVQLAIEVGPPAVRDQAAAAGVAEEQFETAQLGPNIALGTYQVSALDQATGYATFANHGVHIPAHMVTKVVGPEGEELTPNDADQLEGTRAFSEDVAADSTYAMQQVVSEDGGGSEAMLPDGRPVAGKTGTSNDAVSAWFAGYTPQLATAVGLFRDEGKQLEIPGVQDVYGGTTSAKIWREFMTTAMEGEPVEEFPAKAGVGEAQSFLPVEPTPTPSETVPETPEPSTPPSPTIPDTPSPSTPSSSPETPGEDCVPFLDPGCEDENGGGDEGGEEDRNPDNNAQNTGLAGRRDDDG